MNTYQYKTQRNIRVETLRKFGITTCSDKNNIDTHIVIPWGEKDNEGAYKAFQTRTLTGSKEYNFEGNVSGLGGWGPAHFTRASFETIIITEGVFDALSCYDMLNGNVALYSVKSSSTIKHDLSFDRDYINSFSRIVLCLDNDEQGRKATKQLANYFDVNKVFYFQASNNVKDANEYLSKGMIQEFILGFKGASRFRPKGVVSSFDEIQTILENDNSQARIASFPFPSLDEMTYGIREGELILFKAQEKIGKTECMRAIEHHLLKTTDHNIGIIHLEEQERRTVCGLVGYEVQQPVHLPDRGYSNQDILTKYKELVKKDDRVTLYSHFGTEDPDVILDVIRYMVTVKDCKFIFLDHITMLVTGLEEDDERKKLDYISTRLAMMTRELKFTLFLVSHVNDNGQTRGSRNIGKVSDLIVMLSRDIEAANQEERNTTTILVQGNRYAGTTGPCKPLFFNATSYILKEKDEMDGVPI
jgi:twinkle protein